MHSRVTIGGLAVLVVLSLSVSAYLYFRGTQLENRIAQLEPLVNRVAQLEQTTKEQKAAIDRVQQTAREQKEAIDTLETISLVELNARVDQIERAVNPPLGRFFYHDDANKLDQPTIERAAQSLVDRGAQVAVYTVSSDGGPDEFLQRLEQDGLYSGGGVHPTLIAIYVSFSPRYSEIRGGDNWNNALKTNNNIDAIRHNELNPGLVAGDYTSGVVNALVAIDQGIKSNP
jgi:hypothetical protein